MMLHSNGSSTNRSRRTGAFARPKPRSTNPRPLGLFPPPRSDADNSPVNSSRELACRARELERQHERLLRELYLAEQVQRSMVSKRLPDMPGVRIGAALRPCELLAGDFYQVSRLDRDHIGFLVGDVMGHGPAAALLSVFTLQQFRPKWISGSSYRVLAPSEVLAELNRTLIAAEFPESPFVTLAYGVLDTTTLRFTYCTAGHPPIIHAPARREASVLEIGGLLLGVYETEFRDHVIDLEPGDRLVMHSDGLEHARFGTRGIGITGLLSWLSQGQSETLQEAVDGAMGVLDFGDRPADDVTLLAAEIVAA